MSNQYEPTSEVETSDVSLGDAGDTTASTETFSDTYSGTYPGTSTETYSGSTESSGGAKASDAAKQVGQDAVDTGKQVAQTAKDEAQGVVSEAKDQAQNLFHEARGQLSDQASTQQNNAAQWLRELADEMKGMLEGRGTGDAEGSASAGLASQRGTQAHGQVGTVAQWLEDHEPADLLSEVSRFARRRPGAFLAIAAAAGLLAGRLTRGLTSSDDSDSSSHTLSAGYTGGYTGGSMDVSTSSSYTGYAGDTSSYGGVSTPAVTGSTYETYPV